MDPSFQVPDELSLQNQCRCPAKDRICTGKNNKRLEFFGTHDEQTHDEQSHAVDYSKTLSYKQIVTIHDAVMVAPKQSATVLRRNLIHAQGSPEQHKHMPPSQLRCIQRRVQISRKILTQQKLAAATVPESLGALIGWCDTKDFMSHCAITTILPMSIAFHSFLLLFSVVISRLKDKLFKSAFPHHGFC